VVTSTSFRTSIFKLKEDQIDKPRFIVPSLRANRIVSYLESLKQDYELPEMSFIQQDEEIIETSELSTVSESKNSDSNLSKLPTWLASQIASGKEIYMKAAPGGGLCFTCHQPTGLGLPGQFPPLAGSDWVNPTRITNRSTNC